MAEASGVEDHGRELDRLIHGFQVSRMIRLAADLAVADLLAAEASRSVEDLAGDCAVEAAPLLRVLRALAAFGIFRVSVDGMVAHSPRSLLLRSDAAGSLRHSARFWAGTGSWRAWEALDAALTGGVPHEAAWQAGRFQYLAAHPDEARIFDGFMARFPDDRHGAIAAAYDFTDARLIVDVGGGNGELLRRILARYPGPRGMILDRADVVAAIPEAARADGRITVQGGDFFEMNPPAADLYLVVRVLHDWSDENCARILRQIRAAMPAGARLLIGESLLDPDPAHGSPELYLLDMQMMAMFGSARERTESGIHRLLETCGFAPLPAIATTSSVTILPATAV